METGEERDQLHGDPTESSTASAARESDSSERDQRVEAMDSSSASVSTSMGMFYGIGDGDDSINIIEDGDHVSAEDFGLSSTDLSINSMTPAMSGMHMNMELNALQIQAFLSRNDNDSQVSHGPVTSSVTTTSSPSDNTAPPQRHSHEQECLVEKKSQMNTPETAGATATKDVEPHPIGTTNAYDASKHVVYYSRREDKIKQIREHPIVRSVTPDGRTIICKCGRNVRLNPPWYILKFEQHLVSRNCTFLRKKKPKTTPVSITVTVAKDDADVGNERTEQSRTVGESGMEVVNDNNERRLDSHEMIVNNNQAMINDGSKISKSNMDILSAKKVSTSEMGTASDGRHDDDSYGLKPLDVILARDFGIATDQTTILAPSSSAPETKLKQYESAMVLRANPHFSQITPDGRFIECKCSKLIVLSGPWMLGKFFEHIAEKRNIVKKRIGVSGGVAKKPKKASATPNQTKGNRLGENVSLRVKRKSFPREIRWDVVQARGILPCPGLRDQKMNVFVGTSVQLVGGSRPRYKIAQEYFPHIFPITERNSINQKLSAEEKVTLHDIIEGEAIWFVDKDGNSVRSLDCRGIIETSKGESICAQCAELRFNPSLRTAISATSKKAKTPRNPLNRKFCSSRVFSQLESEFNMNEEYARILRDLSLVEIPDGSSLNVWLDMGYMGIEGAFDSHPALIGLVESMVTLKHKERRGVGMQNMNYSQYFDAFMRTLADVSVDAYDFFQHHLCGRKQKLPVGKKRKHPSIVPTSQVPMQASSNDITGNADKSFNTTSSEDHHSHHHELLYDPTSTLGNPDNFVNLLDAPGSHMMPSLSISDINDVDLSSLSTVTPSEIERTEHVAPPHPPSEHDHVNDADESSAAEQQTTTDAHDEEDDGEEGLPSDDTTPIDTTTCSSNNATPPKSAISLDQMPCTGLRDERVQAYVSNAVQIIGGSRPKYVIAKELFPAVFSGDLKVKIAEKLTIEQKYVLQDAVFSECMWRVDKVGNCVRSLRCLRVADRKAKGGVCRSCRDLKSIPNFRSVLSRAKMPKNPDNVKYVPSVYTESDPFLRKLSKNGSFRALYHIVKQKAESDTKKVVFWLKCARMGVFGHFRTHPVFEGLMESMVEIKDKERRGVGKQNMQYSKPLDDFMNAFSAVSVEAFELFAGQFCGRTIRSQKVKKRKTITSTTHLFNTALQSAISEAARSEAVSAPAADRSTVVNVGIDGATNDHQHHHHHLMTSDDLPLSSSDMEESQRFMDRMLDEVRLSVHHDMHLPDINGSHMQDKQRESGEHTLDPQTYLDEAGVLTTEI